MTSIAPRSSDEMTILFVDDEPQVIEGLRRMLKSESAAWKMRSASNYTEAMEQMTAGPVDILVTDLELPFQSGKALLNAVEARFPSTIRVVLSSADASGSNVHPGLDAHMILSKPCSRNSIITTLKRLEKLQEIIGNKEISELMTRIKVLPPVPETFSLITRELQKEEPSMKELGTLIENDPALSTKILQLANSPVFAVPGGVTKPSECVKFLGLETIKALALMIGTMNINSGLRNSPYLNMENFASHSTFAANMALRAAHALKMDGKSLETCYTASLLHDIGKLALAHGMADVCDKIAYYGQRSDLTVMEAERFHLGGTTHADVGAYLLGIWGFPEETVSAVARHHGGRHSFETQTHNWEEISFPSPWAIVCLANLLSRQIDPASPEFTPALPEMEKAFGGSQNLQKAMAAMSGRS